MNARMAGFFVAALTMSAAANAEKSPEEIAFPAIDRVKDTYQEAIRTKGLDEAKLKGEYDAWREKMNQKCEPIQDKIKHAHCVAESASAKAWEFDLLIERVSGLSWEQMPKNYIDDEMLSRIAVGTVGSYYQYSNGVAYIKHIEDACWDSIKMSTDYYPAYLCAVAAYMGSMVDANQARHERRFVAPVYAWATVNERVLQEFKKKGIDDRYAEAIVNYANVYSHRKFHPALQNAGMR